MDKEIEELRREIQAHLDEVAMIEAAIAGLELAEQLNLEDGSND